jgi:hypothetical protein
MILADKSTAALKVPNRVPAIAVIPGPQALDFIYGINRLIVP